MSFHGSQYGAAHGPGDADDIEAASERVAEEMLATQSPRQQELADRIFRELADGAEVDDIKDLIGELSRTATEDARHRTEVPRAGGFT